MDNQKHYVKVNSETFRLIHNNGGFLITTTNPTANQQLEPITNAGYGNMNYSTQTASGVTSYLNSNNEDRSTNRTSTHQDGYLFNSSEVVDLTKVSSCPRHCTTDIPEKEVILDLSKTPHSVSNSLGEVRSTRDSPVCIDLTSENDMIEVLPNVERLRHDNGHSSTNGVEPEKSDDDDEVIFVKQFRFY